MTDEPNIESTLEDRAELELRERVTLLEEWRRWTEPAIGLLLLGLLALAAAGLLTNYTIRKLHR